MTRAQFSHLNTSYRRGLASSLFLLDDFKQRLTMAQILLAVAWIQDTAFAQSIRETGAVSGQDAQPDCNWEHSETRDN